MYRGPCNAACHINRIEHVLMLPIQDLENKSFTRREISFDFHDGDFEIQKGGGRYLGDLHGYQA